MLNPVWSISSKDWLSVILVKWHRSVCTKYDAKVWCINELCIYVYDYDHKVNYLNC